MMAFGENESFFLFVISRPRYIIFPDIACCGFFFYLSKNKNTALLKSQDSRGVLTKSAEPMAIPGCVPAARAGSLAEDGGMLNSLQAVPSHDSVSISSSGS